MNIDKKATIYKKEIEKLENEVSVLRRENLYLKQLIPSNANGKEIQKAISQHKATLDELTELKKKYKDVLREISSLKHTYKTEMERLLNRIKKSR